jgi:hypothetical protein
VMGLIFRVFDGLTLRFRHFLSISARLEDDFCQDLTVGTVRSSPQKDRLENAGRSREINNDSCPCHLFRLFSLSLRSSVQFLLH